MAKAAKTGVETEVTDKAINTFLKEVLDHYKNIESARGTYMVAARGEREGMTALYEGMASRGISQKAAKTEIKIIRALERIGGWIADLEDEDRRMVARLAQAQDDTGQMQMFDLPRVRKVRKRKANGGNNGRAKNGTEGSETARAA